VAFSPQEDSDSHDLIGLLQMLERKKNMRETEEHQMRRIAGTNT
jgi:hypothetical protein